MTEMPVGEPTYHVLSVGNVLVDPGRVELADSSRTGSPTITLIRSGGRSVLVDPGCGPMLNQAHELQRLMDALVRHIDPHALTCVFLTHLHDDHCNLASYIRANEHWGFGEVIPGVVACPALGHTPDHRVLFFRSGGDRVAVAGDAVINEAYFTAQDPQHRVYAPNGYTEDEVRQSVTTMELIRRSCDLIIPGHGEPFRASRTCGES